MSAQDDEKRPPPPVAWAERKTLIYMTINVTDCKTPVIKLNKDSLYFKGQNDEGVEFEVTLEFFKEVNVETSKYSVKDRAIDFILRKAEEGAYWNRLLKDNKKYHWLRIDFTKWKDEDDSDLDINDEGDFDEMMKRMSGLESTSNDLNDLESDEEED